MNWLQHEYFGYATTPQQAGGIIQHIGLFYLCLGGAYFLSMLIRILNAHRIQKRIKLHILRIIMWLGVGSSLLLYPGHVSIVISYIIIVYSFLGLYYVQFPAALMNHQTLKLSDLAKSDNKKVMYALVMMKRRGLDFKDMFESTLINDHILWLLILYHALVSLRASLSM